MGRMGACRGEFHRRRVDVGQGEGSGLAPSEAGDGSDRECLASHAACTRGADRCHGGADYWIALLFSAAAAGGGGGARGSSRRGGRGSGGRELDGGSNAGEFMAEARRGMAGERRLAAGAARLVSGCAEFLEPARAGVDSEMEEHARLSARIGPASASASGDRESVRQQCADLRARMVWAAHGEPRDGGGVRGRNGADSRSCGPITDLSGRWRWFWESPWSGGWNRSRWGLSILAMYIRRIRRCGPIRWARKLCTRVWRRCRESPSSVFIRSGRRWMVPAIRCSSSVWTRADGPP